MSTTLADVIRSKVERYPDGTLTEIDWAGRRVSASNAQLYQRATELLAEIEENIPDRNADIVLGFESVVDFVPALWACVLGGYTCLPWQIHRPRFTGESAAEKFALFAEKLDRPALVTTERLKALIGDRQSVFSNVVTLASRADQGIRHDGPPIRRPDRLSEANGERRGASFLIVTSGTTSRSKIAIIDFRTALSRLHAYEERTGSRLGLGLFPFDSVSGLWIALRREPRSFYLQPERLAAHPGELLSIVEEFRIEALGLSTSLAARICDAAEKSPREFDLSSLKHVGFGAEMIVPEVVRRLASLFTEIRAKTLKISFGYGMTETGLICCTPELPADEAMAGLARGDAAPSIGTLVRGWSLRIVDDDDNPLAAGTIGNVQVWSKDAMFSGYRDDPQLNAESFTSDRWFRTGDLGVAENGELWLAGRQKSTIIVNGRNISLERIEAPLREMQGVRKTLIAAVAVRQSHSTTDELALFFVPQSFERSSLDALCRSMLRETARNAGISVSHFIPLDEADVPLTATGKIRRGELADRLRAGRLVAHRLRRGENKASKGEASSVEDRLRELWKNALNLDFLPGADENFFDLGGDSLASSEIFAAIEEGFGCDLPIEAFFQAPTIATLCALVSDRPSDVSRQRGGPAAPSGNLLLHKLQSFSGSWTGDRLFPESLLVGLNTAGANAPIFWVFQRYKEFQALATHFGPDQPIYGMRSCVGIVDARQYSTEILEAVGNRYLWELLSLAPKEPVVIGGNCQGGIIALHLARKLKAIRREPSLLVLLDWTYDFGLYDAPTLLIYGDQSHTVGVYGTPQTSGPNWRHDFPRGIAVPIPGKHGRYFDKRVGGLVSALSRHANLKRGVAGPGESGCAASVAAHSIAPDPSPQEDP